VFPENNYKLIYVLERDEKELYNLNKDPLEVTNIYPDNKSLAALLHDR